MKKVAVSILGATGSVGQRFVELLSNHPWFQIVSLAASDRSAGKKYADVVNWLMPSPLSKEIGEMEINLCEPGIPGNIAFSALDSSVAGDIEAAFAHEGYTVISNARNHRMHPSVPLLIPEINNDHLDMVKQYTTGQIVTNPNCSTIGLCLALKPLYDAFGIESVHVVTMQAISGAGYPGVASLDVIDNVIPYIKGEEEKLETEPLKILGKLVDGRIQPADFSVSAQCNRVPVIDGHMECVSIKLKNKASPEDLIHAWRTFSGIPQKLQLPSAPQYPIHYLEGDAFPQPRLHRNIDKGMAVTIGRLRPCPLFDYKFTLLSHNTIRGAAGGAILCAELMHICKK
ncbi:MAG: aspartate-semialdehyde dehydrogenase [Parachlamydiaceae bacterium]